MSVVAAARARGRRLPLAAGVAAVLCAGLVGVLSGEPAGAGSRGSPTQSAPAAGQGVEDEPDEGNLRNHPPANIEDFLDEDEHLEDEEGWETNLTDRTSDGAGPGAENLAIDPDDGEPVDAGSTNGAGTTGRSASESPWDGDGTADEEPLSPSASELVENIANADDDSSGGSPWSTLLVILAAVIAAGAFVMWRRGQFSESPEQRELASGTRLALPAGSDQPADSAGALRPEDEPEDVEPPVDLYVEGQRRLDMALRAAVAGTGGRGLPPLAWVETSPESVDLVLESPAPPPNGFTAVNERTWRTSSPVEVLGRLAGATAAPAPTLIPVGMVDENTELLIELESSGVVSVDGDEADALGVLRSLALAVASAPWNERTRLVLVGMTGGLTELDEVTEVGSLSEALVIAGEHAVRTADVLWGLDSPSTSQARAAGVRPETWTALVVLSAVRPDDPADRRRLRDLAVLSHSGVAPITLAPIGAVLPGRMLTFRDDGSLRIDGVDKRVWPRLVEDGAADGLVYVVGSEEAGGEPVDQEPDGGAPDEEPEVDRIEDLLEGAEVLVRVLGTVEAVRVSTTTAPGAEERLVPSRPKALEAITYLALREAAVDREALEIRLFPNGTNVPKTVYNTISAARNLLGEELFPAPDNGRYELSDAVVTDYGLFCELIGQADETDDPDLAVALLTDALGLVGGEPFMGPGRNYAWVGPHRGMIVGHVVDAAEELGEMHLALGDWRSAEWAARQGLRAFPSDERLYRLLMRAAAAGGNVGSVRRAYAELCEVIADPEIDPDPERTISTETVALFEELTSPARAASG